MDKLFEAKEYIRKFYAKNSRYVDIGLRFLLALFTFIFVGRYVGFLEILANPVVIIGLAIVCTFLSLEMTAVVAAMVTLLQLAALAPGVAVVAGVVILVMFAFYFRFAPGKTVVLLLTPIAFMYHVPTLIPIMFGLIGSQVSVVPIVFGVIIYYMISYVEAYATVIETVAETGFMGQITTFMQQLLANKEMWMVAISFTICLLLTHNIKKLSVDHAWEVAAVTGALTNLIMMTFGHVLMDIQVAYVELALGSLLAIAVAVLSRVFIFSVEYSRSEYLQFEDDEYYYYVKAIPKVSVSVREKTVKKINVRQETEAIDVEAVRKASDEMNGKEMQETAEERTRRIQLEDSEIQRLIEEELKK